MTLETPRLLLRYWEESDAPVLFRYASDPEIGRWTGFPPHTGVADSRDTIRKALSGPLCFAVVPKEVAGPVGCIELMPYSGSGSAPSLRDAELGYWVGVPFWGRGYIPEAAEALLRYGFVRKGLKTVWCGYFEGNERSRRVQEKLGFRPHHTEPPTGRQPRLTHVSRLTAEEWRQRHGGSDGPTE
ncbi:MAG: GNAT family N-acetyltransferase [Clostridiales bacterium]|nr:GNAT family N-acetyltransferase [Clostridiales bacterium]